MKTEIEENNCPNCNNPIIDNFCSNCGQRKYKRIDRKYILEELQYVILHTNKGLFYSLKKIIKNPGKTAREFVDGNRVNHYKPILLVFLLSGIAAFLSFVVIDLHGIMKEIYSQKGTYSDFMQDIFSLFSSFFSFIMLLFIPVLAFFTKIVFRKWGHNYYEHVIMNAYFISFFTVLEILFYPVLYLFKDNIDIFMSISYIPNISIPFVLIWFYKGFYKDKSLKSIILKVLLLFILLFIGFIFLIIVITFLLFSILGQEATMLYLNVEAP
jgi:Protein of unknown function (DUF3667).